MQLKGNCWSKWEIAMKKKKEGNRKINKAEKKKLRIKIIVTIVSLLLINILAMTSYYSYSNWRLMNEFSSENIESKVENIENLSLGQRNFIQGQVIAELKKDFKSGFFIFSFSLVLLSFLAAIFLINSFGEKAEGNTLMSELGKLRGKMKTGKTSNMMKSSDFKLFGEPRNFMLLFFALLIILSLLILNFIFLRDSQDTSPDMSGLSVQETSPNIISSDSITSITEDFDLLEIYDEMRKIYEISDSSLEKGVTEILNEKDAFRINVNERNYYIMVWNITKDNRVQMIFPGERQLIFGEEDMILIDIDQDNKLDVQLELKSIIEDYENSGVVASVELGDETAIIKDVEQIPKRKAEIYIKKFIEKELIPEGEYFELFDVTVRLAEEEIYTSRNLEAYVTFENFGDGVSEIDIVYSIINENEIEVYRGLDSKVVQTEDRVVKDFDFLKLPVGKYILRTEIFYGQNQTGESEQDFEIINQPFFEILINPLFFVLTILVLGFGVMYARKMYKKRKNEDKNRFKSVKRK